MARRKRLKLPTEPVSVDLETKSATSSTSRARMPIADVAGATAGQAALEEVAREMTAAETEGRVVKKLPMSDLMVHHLSRDRMVFDEEDMEALQVSIAERGQQTPIEVVRLAGGKFGLISGLRRVEALRRLKADHALALIRAPESSQDAYQAMIEENEIRSGVSFFERANIAVATVGQGVFPNAKTAVKVLFARAPKAKRSKILKFVTIRDKLGASLKFPTAIPEKLGLALAQALTETPHLAGTISKELTRKAPKDATAERRILEAALRRGPGAGDKPGPEQLAKGLSWTEGDRRVVLSGAALDVSFLADLRDWVTKRAKG